MNGSTYLYSYWPAPGGATVLHNYPSSGAVYIMHKDWLGNARLGSDLATTVIDDYAYAPYGEKYDIFGSTSQNETMFIGLTQDVKAGMYDTPNRELQGSQQGRFLSPDPAGFGWNQYAYPTNPNSFIDASGLQKIGPRGTVGNTNAGGSDPLLGGNGTFGAGGVDCGTIGGTCNPGSGNEENFGTYYGPETYGNVTTTSFNTLNGFPVGGSFANGLQWGYSGPLGGDALPGTSAYYNQVAGSAGPTNPLAVLAQVYTMSAPTMNIMGTVFVGEMGLLAPVLAPEGLNLTLGAVISDASDAILGMQTLAGYNIAGAWAMVGALIQ
jgi:RHS repeat-associated protein